MDWRGLPRKMPDQQVNGGCRPPEDPIYERGGLRQQRESLDCRGGSG